MTWVDRAVCHQSLGRVVVHALGRVQRFDEARAHEDDNQLRVVREGQTIARFDRGVVHNWWHEEAN